MGTFLKSFGSHDSGTLEQMLAVTKNAEYTALMADGHRGYVMPIGGVAAYDNHVSPMGVGVDIGCGNCAIRTDIRVDSLSPSDIIRLADRLQSELCFGAGRTNTAVDAPINEEFFYWDAWRALPKEADVAELRSMARKQLGTIGSGNHYVDVFAGDDGMVWVGVHFGSRGLGFKIAQGFHALSMGVPWGTKIREEERLLSLDSELGSSYWEAMQLAGHYAYVGRDWVARKVVALLGGQETYYVHNHHNFAWMEVHFGRKLVVVRKGATPAFPFQEGFVGGSMGDTSVILRGMESPVAQKALYSTVHGAGRVMSRTRAAGKYKGWGNKRKLVAPGEVSPEMMREWLAREGVVLRGGGLDESPHAYRRLPDVLASHADTIDVGTTLRPLIVVMAGDDVFDPYKD